MPKSIIRLFVINSVTRDLLISIGALCKCRWHKIVPYWTRTREVFYAESVCMADWTVLEWGAGLDWACALETVATVISKTFISELRHLAPWRNEPWRFFSYFSYAYPERYSFQNKIERHHYHGSHQQAPTHVGWRIPPLLRCWPIRSL